MYTKSHFSLTDVEIDIDLARILSDSLNSSDSIQDLKKIYSCIDNTTLEGSDNNERIKKFCTDTYLATNVEKEIKSVASVCVYPTFVKLAKECLIGKGIRVASVAGGFPSAQMPFYLRLKEVKYAVDEGADEIDTVLSRGMLLEGKYDAVFEELTAIRSACKGLKLKVILETGDLQTTDNIYIASKIALAAGADFIKTSTGKIAVGATEKAAYIMLKAIQEEAESTGRVAGFKAAGGISTARQALNYYKITEYFLGNNIDNNLFRIGASRLTKLLYEQLTA
jgi:deoxyribose-phosphate aldolase